MCAYVFVCLHKHMNLQSRLIRKMLFWYCHRCGQCISRRGPSKTQPQVASHPVFPSDIRLLLIVLLVVVHVVTLVKFPLLLMTMKIIVVVVFVMYGDAACF